MASPNNNNDSDDDRVATSPMEEDDDVVVNVVDNTTDTRKSVSPPPFAIEERIYCRDDNTQKYYEAIIKQVKLQGVEGTWKFYVHYNGWNNRWDRWVHADCIFKDTAEMRRIVQQQQEQEREQQTSLKRRAAAAANADDGSTGRNTKRRTGVNSSCSRRGYNNNHHAAANNPVLVYSDYCELPLTLKTVLVEEYERLTRQGWDSPHGYDNNRKKYPRPARSLHVLPSPVPIRKVIQHFSKKKCKEIAKQAVAADDDDDDEEEDQTNTNNKNKPQLTAEHIRIFCEGLVQLFEQALSNCLLYPQERPQYEKTVPKLLTPSDKESEGTKKELVDIYGCEYLLRLFVRLPILLQPSAEAALMNPSPDNPLHDIPNVMGPLLTELLVLLQKNRQALFKVSGNYKSPTDVEEWMDWEQKIYGDCSNTIPNEPSLNKTAAEMDTTC